MSWALRNRRFKKRSNVGGRRLPIWLVALVISGWGLEGHSEKAIRIGWIFDQLAAPPLATTPEATRHQLEASVVNYEDAFSGVAAVQVDLRWVELRVRGSQRLFLQTTPEGGRLFNSLDSESRSIGAELARYIVTPGGQHGRLGLEILQFPPRQSRWFKFSLATGILPSPSVPWAFRLSLNQFTSMQSEGSFMHLSSDTVRSFSLGARSTLEIGGSFTWVNRSRGLAGTGSFERMLFSFAPIGAYRGDLGRIAVSIPLRVWLDTELVSDKIVAEPSEFAAPSLAATWTLPL